MHVAHQINWVGPTRCVSFQKLQKRVCKNDNFAIFASIFKIQTASCFSLRPASTGELI